MSEDVKPYAAGQETLTVVFKGRTVVVVDPTGSIVAAGSPKGVSDTLKERWARRIDSAHGLDVSEMVEQGGD